VQSFVSSFFFQAEDGIRDLTVTGVQTCALPICTGRLVEYPYSTPIGSLNMILSASEQAVKENPQRVKLIVDMHRQAVDYAMATRFGEGRVGEEGRSRRAACHLKKKKQTRTRQDG